MTYPPAPVFRKVEEPHTAELPILELCRKRNISDLEFESITLTARGKTMKEAQDGIVFLMQCEDALRKDESGGDVDGRK